MQAPSRANNGAQVSNGPTRANVPQPPQTPKAGLSRSGSGAGSNVQVRAAQQSTDSLQGKQPLKYFAVRVGRVPGIYGTWVESNKQVADFLGAESKFKLPLFCLLPLLFKTTHRVFQNLPRD